VAALSEQAPWRARSRPRTIPAWALTAAFGVAYVIVAPISSDLAAAGYRSELFSRAGFTLWDNGWYGGHHLPAYSLIAPALGSLMGVQLLGALAAVLSTALFGALVDGRFASRATRVGTLWFALGASVALLANRIPFELGTALGLAALLAAQRASELGAHDRRDRDAGRRRLGAGAAVALAALSALASPVAGAFVALAAIAWALDGVLDVHAGFAAARVPLFALALAAAALAPAVLLAIAFPEGGAQPFVASAFYPALAAVLAFALVLPAEQRLLRSGALLYALALLGAYLIPSALGGNADRLGSLFAGPLLACALIGARAGARRRRDWALLVLALALLYWQVKAPIADAISAAGDPAAKQAYYEPLLAELERLDVGYGAHAARIEVVPTRNHAEARWVASRVMLARGWERQLDTQRDGLFYEPAQRLTPERYRAWLDEDAISYVALADAPLDYSGRAERRLIDSGPGYLHEVWHSTHWRLFSVASPVALAQPPSVLSELESDSFSLRAPRAGRYEVRVRFTPYWALSSGRGCVSRAPGAGEWTDVQTDAAGSVRVAIDFSPARVFEHGARCS
jgi:hypothetical protein